MSHITPTDSPSANDEPVLHNPVLTRTHEPPRAGNHSWIMLGGLAIVIIGAAAFWAFAATHPAGPIVNHAVAQSTTTYTPAQSSGAQSSGAQSSGSTAG